MSAGPIAERLELGKRAGSLVRSGNSVRSGTTYVSRVETALRTREGLITVPAGFPGEALHIWGSGFGRRGGRVFFMPDPLNPVPDNWADGRGYWGPRANAWRNNHISIEVPDVMRRYFDDEDSVQAWLVVVCGEDDVAGIRIRITTLANAQR